MCILISRVQLHHCIECSVSTSNSLFSIVQLDHLLLSNCLLGRIPYLWSAIYVTLFFSCWKIIHVFMSSFLVIKYNNIFVCFCFILLFVFNTKRYCLFSFPHQVLYKTLQVGQEVAYKVLFTQSTLRLQLQVYFNNPYEIKLNSMQYAKSILSNLKVTLNLSAFSTFDAPRCSWHSINSK